MIVLLVEDGISDRALILSCIEAVPNISVLFSRTIEDARAMMPDADLAVVDLNLPDGDGVALSEADGCPVIYMSGDQLGRLLEVSEATGSAALPKSENGYRLLLATIRRCCQQQAEERRTVGLLELEKKIFP